MANNEPDERLNLPSASSFHRLVECPGSRALIASLPSGPESAEPPDPDAEAGTKLHKALETDNPLDLDEEQSETFRSAKKFEQAILYQWVTENDLDQSKITGPFQEVRLWLNDNETLEPLLSGQLDAYWLCVPHALILERKMGFGVWVPPSHKSHQGRVQSVLLWKEVDGLEFIRFATSKPKVKAEPTDFTVYDRKALQESLGAILWHLEQAKDPDAPRRAGSVCRYCRAKAFCPEAAAMSLLPSVIAKDGDWKTAVQQLSGPDLVKLWSTEAVVNKIYEAVKQRLKAMPDWQLGELGLERGKGRRIETIVDAQATWEFLKSTGAEDKDLWATVKFSIAELADMLKATRGFSPEGSRQYIRESLASFMETKEAEAPLKRKAD